MMLRLGGQLKKTDKSNGNYYDSGQVKLIILKLTEILYLNIGLNCKNLHNYLNYPT